MQPYPRLAALAGAIGLSLAVTACGAEEPAPPGDGGQQSPAAPTSAPSTGTGEQGVTQIADIYGPACDQVPQEGEGSAQGMVDDPVGTAASNNPLLSTLTQAVTAAGLVDTLNNADATYTVFAPANSAFEALPPGTLDQVLADPQGQLTEILTYHVLPERFDAQGLAEAGTVTTVQGSELTISGEPQSLTIDEQEQATVLCGNVPTANATVFVIDTVLMPPPA